MECRGDGVETSPLLTEGAGEFGAFGCHDGWPDGSAYRTHRGPSSTACTSMGSVCIVDGGRSSSPSCHVELDRIPRLSVSSNGGLYGPVPRLG